MALVCSLLGCTQTTGETTSETTVETLRVPAKSRVDEAYLKPDVDFSGYRRLQAAPLEIYFYQGMGEPDPAVAERIRAIFRRVFLAAIGDDYPLSDEPAPDVLAVRASLLDLKHSPVMGKLPVQGRAARLAANGQLTFFMELRDSVSGELLARAADQEKPPAPGEVMSDIDAWAQTERAATRWAGLFRDFLDENFARD
ncbi:MAG: DUF3313 family protein [Gammaproteobacteria bacterium]